MKTIIIIFGGKTVEHEISVLTALHAGKHVVNYRVHYVYITRENRFLTGEVLKDIDFYINKKTRGTKACWFSEGALYTKRWFGVSRTPIAAVLNCCHGGVGENGELAALMKIAGIPLVSCGTEAAINTQSKTRTREVLSAAGYMQPKFLSFVDKQQIAFEEVFEKLGKKVIIKPDTLGSSVGISVVSGEQELSEALELAFSLDKKVVAEEYIENMYEVNCSAFRRGNEIYASECEKVENDRVILDFEKKYLQRSAVRAKKFNAETDGKPNQSSEVFKKIQDLTKQAYQLFGCSGVVRADFMVAGEKIYLTELNTVPGFLAYHLWARTGMPYGVLIDALIKQACVEAGFSLKLNTVFESKILETNRRLVK